MAGIVDAADQVSRKAYDFMVNARNKAVAHAKDYADKLEETQKQLSALDKKYVAGKNKAGKLLMEAKQRAILAEAYAKDMSSQLSAMTSAAGSDIDMLNRRLDVREGIINDLLKTRDDLSTRLGRESSKHDKATRHIADMKRQSDAFRRNVRRGAAVAVPTLLTGGGAVGYYLGNRSGKRAE